MNIFILDLLKLILQVYNIDEKFDMKLMKKKKRANIFNHRMKAKKKSQSIFILCFMCAVCVHFREFKGKIMNKQRI